MAETGRADARLAILIGLREDLVNVTRVVSITGLANARDLGGLDRHDGTLTPSGVFIRTEMLDRVDAAGWEQLRCYGVKTVIDLRRPAESTGEVPPDIVHIRLDLDGDEAEFWTQYEADGRWGTPLYYLPHLRKLPHRLTGVLRAIAAADDGAVLFHCAAGWDRTGLVAAVLLRALDVTTDAAVADYLASFANADAMAALHGRSFEVEERHRVLDRFGHTAESAFREMYETLDLEAWFDEARVDTETRAPIQTWRGSARRSNG
ncbi:MAG: tyrosine-protein phosphatase [Microlunatus sp.]